MLSAVGLVKRGVEEVDQKTAMLRSSPAFFPWNSLFSWPGEGFPHRCVALRKLPPNSVGGSVDKVFAIARSPFIPWLAEI